MPFSQHIGWVARNIVLPLLPFVVGAFIRGIYAGGVTADTFSLEELAFSIAMLSITMLASINRLQDDSRRGPLSVLFICVTVGFIATYGCVVLLTSQVSAGQGLSPASAQTSDSWRAAAATLNRFRWFVYPAAIVTIALSVLMKIRFRLDE